MAEIAPKGKPRSTTCRDEGRSDSGLPSLRVRYYRQMKPQRVYTAEVFWQKSERPPRGEVTVRLLVAGAQVLPAEQTMDSAKPDLIAVFYVTPLAKGWLRNYKLEVLSQGRKVQEIPLASKVVTQRFTWFLLLCTLFVPWFITEFIKNSPMNSSTRGADDRKIYRHISKEVEDYIKQNVPSLPGFAKGSFVDTGLRDTRAFVAKSYQQLVEVSGIEPIAFYAGAILLSLTLISAYLHKPKRRRAKGKPIPVAAGKNLDEED